MSTNTYTNAKVKLRGRTTIQTAPSSGTSIVKSIRITNTDENADHDITLSVTDSSNVEFILEINRVIQKASSQELLATGTMKNDTADDSMVGANPIILKSSEILKATTTGSDIHLVASILEMT